MFSTLSRCILVICSLVLAGIGAAAAQAEPPKIAILPFENLTGFSDLGHLEKELPVQCRMGLADYDGVQVIWQQSAGAMFDAILAGKDDKRPRVDIIAWGRLRKRQTSKPGRLLECTLWLWRITPRPKSEKVTFTTDAHKVQSALVSKFPGALKSLLSKTPSGAATPAERAAEYRALAAVGSSEGRGDRLPRKGDLSRSGASEDETRSDRRHTWPGLPPEEPGIRAGVS
jgi:hypothetical protein